MEPNKRSFLDNQGTKKQVVDLNEVLDSGVANRVSESFMPDFSLYTGHIKDPILTPNITEMLPYHAYRD